jgi:hypothetical protein
MRSGVSIMIPNKKAKNRMALTKLSKTQRIFIQKFEKQSSDGHVLQ